MKIPEWHTWWYTVVHTEIYLLYDASHVLTHLMGYGIETSLFFKDLHKIKAG